MRTLLGVLGLLMLLGFTGTHRHPVHTSLTQIQYNPGARSYEVSLRLFTDDLELALARFHKVGSLHLDSSPASESRIWPYIQAHFRLGTGGSARYTPVAVEVGHEAVQIYLEWNSPPVRELAVQNSALTEIYDDQNNLVTLEQQGQKQSAVLSRSQKDHVFRLEGK